MTTPGSHHRYSTASTAHGRECSRSARHGRPKGADTRSPRLLALSLALLWTGVLSLPGGMPMAYAAPVNGTAFTTNFDPTAFGAGASFQTGNAGCAFAQPCASTFLGNGDPTAFHQQVESINGIEYFHVIVGDPAAGFAEEYYTPFGAGNGADNSLQGGTNPYGAGMELSVLAPTLTSGSESGNYAFLTSTGNAGNPLDSLHKSGSGGGDPTHAVFHMVMTSAAGDMSLDVNKPFLDRKPVISQTVQDGSMSSTFVADMTGLTYSNDKVPGKITNNLTIHDATIPGSGAADFSMAQAQQSTVTAGRFTFTPGTGWNNSIGWDTAGSAYDLGTYSYAGGSGFDVFTADWTAFFNYSQNALACERVDNHQRLDEGSNGVGSCPKHP